MAQSNSGSVSTSISDDLIPSSTKENIPPLSFTSEPVLQWQISGQTSSSSCVTSTPTLPNIEVSSSESRNQKSAEDAEEESILLSPSSSTLAHEICKKYGSEQTICSHDPAILGLKVITDHHLPGKRSGTIHYLIP